MQIFFAKLNKVKSEKIRDVTRSLYDVCKADIYKDFLKLFYFVIKYLSIDASRHHKISVNWRKLGVLKYL